MDEADLGNESMMTHLRLAVRQCRDGIDGGGSDRCEDCGRPIPGARRRAVPGCRRCLRCQIEFERRNGPAA